MFHRYGPAIVYAAAFIVFAYDASGNDTTPQGTSIGENGAVHLPAMDVPLSTYMSEEAKQRYVDEAKHPLRVARSYASRAESRKAVDEYYRPFIERGKALYPVEIVEQTIGGVRTDVVTPKSGVAARNRNRVLLCLHQGFWSSGGGGPGGLTEAIPIAGVGKIKVIAVDYRLFPEHKFPAATEDVAAVYQELLKQYPPENIGIYGLSAGGAISMQAVAYFQKHQLPRPGAIGTFGFGGDLDFAGDSYFTLAPLDVTMPLLKPNMTLPPSDASNASPRELAFLGGVDVRDPLASPIYSKEVLAKFPPTLLLAGGRDILLSSVINGHTQLVKAGVDADLHIWEGMGHFFLFEMDLPESKEAYDVIARFFDKHLGAGDIAHR